MITETDQHPRSVSQLLDIDLVDATLADHLPHQHLIGRVLVISHNDLPTGHMGLLVIFRPPIKALKLLNSQFVLSVIPVEDYNQWRLVLSRNGIAGANLIEMENGVVKQALVYLGHVFNRYN